MTVCEEHRHREIASMTVFFRSSHTVIDDAQKTLRLFMFTLTEVMHKNL